MFCICLLPDRRLASYASGHLRSCKAVVADTSDRAMRASCKGNLNNGRAIACIVRCSWSSSTRKTHICNYEVVTSVAINWYVTYVITLSRTMDSFGSKDAIRDFTYCGQCLSLSTLRSVNKPKSLAVR